MRISVIGSGYAGLVSGVGLSDAGHNVLCMDIDEKRIAASGVRNSVEVE